MKMFLASSFDKTASLLKKKLNNKTKGKKVVFISNAADNDTGDKWWIKTDRDAFMSLDCKTIDVDLRNVSKIDFSKILKDSDIIHFCGGSVIYLISLIKERGFDKIITDYIKKDKIIYTGTSAGSMIVAEDLSINAYDPEEKEFINKMKNNSGLGLINFLIMPHTNNKDFATGNSKMVSELPDIKPYQSLIFIFDNQAVWVENNKFEILSKN